MSSPEREFAESSERILRLQDSMRKQFAERQAAESEGQWRIGLLVGGVFLGICAFILLFAAVFGFLLTTFGPLPALLTMGLTMATGAGAVIWFALGRR